MENIFQPIHILILLGGYAFLMIGITYLIRNYRSNKETFLVAGRKVGTIESACSIAATWIWAPALFVAAQEAYTEGWVGVFWFVVPNILCLGIFAWFASRVRSMLPQGFTFSAFIQERFSARCHNIYLFQFTALAICSFAVQILAGASVIKLLTGLPFLWGSILLSLVSLCYSVIIGLKISIVSDTLKMFLIFFIGLPLIVFTVIKGGGLDIVKAGLGGISGGYTSLSSPNGVDVFLRFGLATTIGLIAGPFGDQAFWQRAFSTKKNRVGLSFLLGSLIFGVVPIATSFLGFLAAGSELNVSLVQNTNVFTINYFVGPAGVFLFLIILVASLIGTLDSRLSSIASLAGHDVVQRWIPSRNSDSAAVS